MGPNLPSLCNDTVLQFPHVSKMLTLAFSKVNSVTIKNFIKESRLSQPLSKYYIACNAIVRHSSETILFEQKYHCKYHLSSSGRNWQNTFQQGVDIFRRT
jgi:hypothetical protein